MNKTGFILTEYAAFDLQFLMYSSLTTLLAGKVATNALLRQIDSVSGVVETSDFCDTDLHLPPAHQKRSA